MLNLTKRPKKIFIVILVVVVIAGLAILGYWLYEKYSSDNSEVLNQETISDVKPAKDGKVNVYLFWGKGCPHCEAMGEFLKTIRPDYSKYYNLYTLEVWYNQNNANLQKKIMKQLGDNNSDVEVPFMVIGKQYLIGYRTDWNDKIKSMIINEYNQKNRSDVMFDKSNR